MPKACLIYWKINSLVMFFLPTIKTLEEDIKSEISGNFLKGVLGLLTPRDEYEAQCLREAIHVRKSVFN